MAKKIFNVKSHIWFDGKEYAPKGQTNADGDVLPSTIEIDEAEAAQMPWAVEAIESTKSEPAPKKATS